MGDPVVQVADSGATCPWRPWDSSPCTTGTGPPSGNWAECICSSSCRDGRWSGNHSVGGGGRILRAGPVCHPAGVHHLFPQLGVGGLPGLRRLGIRPLRGLRPGDYPGGNLRGSGGSLLPYYKEAAAVDPRGDGDDNRPKSPAELAGLPQFRGFGDESPTEPRAPKLKGPDRRRVCLDRAWQCPKLDRCNLAARWCSGLTYCPVKAEITGSNPVRVAIFPLPHFDNPKALFGYCFRVF